jgi:hypothetical protein
LQEIKGCTQNVGTLVQRETATSNRLFLCISVGIATGYWLDAWFDFRQSKIFLFPTISRPAVRPTQPPIHMGTADDFPGEKQSGREADHSPPSSAEVKNGGAIPPVPHMTECLIN